MATTVRELVATFGLKVDEGGFRKADQGIGGLTKTLRTVGTILATGAVAKGFQSMVSLASDAVEDMNVVSTSFGDATDATLEWASTTARSANRSEFELRRFVGTTQAMLAPMLGSADAAAQWSKRIVELGVDMGSFFNVADTDAIRAIQSAISGQTEPLRRFGVVMTQAALDQFALQQGIGKTVKQMSEQEKTSLRMQFIFSRLNKVQGDAVKTADEFANASRGIRTGLKDLFTFVGQFFLPSAKDTAVSIRDMVAATRQWVEANRDIIQQDVTQFLRNVGRFGSAIVSAFTGVADIMRNATGEIDPLAGSILKVTAGIIALIALLSIPGLLIAGIGAAIALVIDDFKAWREGGESLLGFLIGRFDELDVKVQDNIATIFSVRDAFIATFLQLGQLAVVFVKTITAPFRILAALLSDGQKGVDRFVKDMQDDFSALVQVFKDPTQFIDQSDTEREREQFRGEELGRQAITRRRSRGLFGTLSENFEDPGRLLGTSVAGAPGGANSVLRAGTVLPSMGAGSSSSTQTNNISVNVEAVPGETAEELSRRVAGDVITEMERKQAEERRQIAEDFKVSG